MGPYNMEKFFNIIKTTDIINFEQEKIEPLFQEELASHQNQNLCHQTSSIQNRKLEIGKESLTVC